MVQVPADILANLMASVEQLRNTIEQVQRDNASMAHEIRLLRARENIGPSFPQFPTLPAEIREIIWINALMAPQIHHMGDDGISRSQVNRTMQACRESQSIALKLNMPYYRMDDYRMDGYCIIKELRKERISPPFYINIDTDTIWLRKCTVLPFNVSLYGGTSPEFDQVEFHQLSHRICPPKLRLNRIAIDFDLWKDPVVNDYGIEDIGSIDILRDNNVRELLLVVVQPSMILRPDVVFVQPTWTPRGLLPNMELRESIYIRGHKSKHPTHDTQWHDAARRLESIMNQLKTKRADDRKRDMEGIVVPSRLSQT